MLREQAMSAVPGGEASGYGALIIWSWEAIMPAISFGQQNVLS
jgi:hypothetical protein